MRTQYFISIISLLLLAGLSPRSAAADSNVLFIFDASGSMKVKVEDGQTRLAVAKKAMAESLQNMPEDVRLGLLLYGHRRAKDCTDIELVSPIGADDAKTIANMVNGLDAKGETPIADSIKKAARSFAALKGQNNRAILVTDGIEECKGDPCAAAQEVKAAGLDLKVDVVGFALNAEQRKTVQCIAQTTGGSYYDAQDVKGLTTALSSVQEEVAKAAPPRAMIAPPEESNLKILTAPNDAWLATVNEKNDEVAWLWKGQEAVYGFKDKRSATFDTFGVFIGGAKGGNPKQFEILVGDESPLGSFRSLGICEVANLQLKNTPFQQCQFASTTAHFVKVRLIEPQNGENTAYATEFQLNAKLSPADTALPKPAGSTIAGATNLLSPASLLASPSDTWSATVDGQDKEVAWLWQGQSAVYGFANDQAAEFDTFSVYIAGTKSGNPKTFELLAGDEGPLGTFRPVATCEFANTKFVEAPLQPCHFAPTTAKYLKVSLTASQTTNDKTAYATEFELLGKPAEGAAAAPAPSTDASSANRTDLLSPANGGSLLGSSSDKWEATIDGKTDNVAWLWNNEEAIYAFKGEQAASFDTFAVYIGSTGRYPKEIEILSGNDGPTGQYQSVATCSFANMKIVQKPFQECKFAPVTAKYVKVKLLSQHGGDRTAYATEFKLFGEMAP